MYLTCDYSFLVPEVSEELSESRIPNMHRTSSDSLFFIAQLYLFLLKKKKRPFFLLLNEAMAIVKSLIFAEKANFAQGIFYLQIKTKLVIIHLN